MIDHKPQILLAPALSNSSCWRSLAGGGYEARWENPGVGEILRAAVILTLSLGILGANLLVICVINSRRYQKHIHAQVSFLFRRLVAHVNSQATWIRGLYSWIEQKELHINEWWICFWVKQSKKIVVLSCNGKKLLVSPIFLPKNKQGKKALALCPDFILFF